MMAGIARAQPLPLDLGGRPFDPFSASSATAARLYATPRHALVAMTGASVTPEVALFTKERRMVYRGRIDDIFEADGKVNRSASKTRDLERALEAVLAAKTPRHATTRAVGCPIADMK